MPTVTEKGQITIPKPLRDSLGIQPGDQLDCEERAGTLVLRRAVRLDPIRALVGIVRERVDVDAYLIETRGPAWNDERDAGGDS